MSRQEEEERALELSLDIVNQTQGLAQFPTTIDDDTDFPELVDDLESVRQNLEMDPNAMEDSGGGTFDTGNGDDPPT